MLSTQQVLKLKMKSKERKLHYGQQQQHSPHRDCFASLNSRVRSFLSAPAPAALSPGLDSDVNSQGSEADWSGDPSQAQPGALPQKPLVENKEGVLLTRGGRTGPEEGPRTETDTTQGHGPA